MSEMTDRIEAALREAMGGQGHVNYPGVARHVLTAMREPTQEMVAPYKDANDDWHGNSREIARGVWQDMINEALK